MSSTVSGGVTLQSTLSVSLAAGGNVLTAYNVPVQTSQSNNYSTGTGANQAQRVAEIGASAAASAASIDLTSVVCADGSTGFSHVREIIVFNDDGTNILLWDFTASNALTACFGAGGTSAKINVQPGTHERKAKPLGTNGYVVDSTHKIVSLDPGSNTIAYRVIIVGD